MVATPIVFLTIFLDDPFYVVAKQLVWASRVAGSIPTRGSVGTTIQTQNPIIYFQFNNINQFNKKK